MVKPKEKIMSAEQSQQSLAGPGKQKDFAKPPDESRWSENPITNRGSRDTYKSSQKNRLFVGAEKRIKEPSLWLEQERRRR